MGLQSKSGPLIAFGIIKKVWIAGVQKNGPRKFKRPLAPVMYHAHLGSEHKPVAAEIYQFVFKVFPEGKGNCQGYPEAGVGWVIKPVLSYFTDIAGGWPNQNHGSPYYGIRKPGPVYPRRDTAQKTIPICHTKWEQDADGS